MKKVVFKCIKCSREDEKSLDDPSQLCEFCQWFSEKQAFVDKEGILTAPTETITLKAKNLTHFNVSLFLDKYDPNAICFVSAKEGLLKSQTGKYYLYFPYKLEHPDSIEYSFKEIENKNKKLIEFETNQIIELSDYLGTAAHRFTWKVIMNNEDFRIHIQLCKMKLSLLKDEQIKNEFKNPNLLFYEILFPRRYVFLKTQLDERANWMARALIEGIEKRKKEMEKLGITSEKEYNKVIEEAHFRYLENLSKTLTDEEWKEYWGIK
jgi:hypothetical protein